MAVGFAWRDEIRYVAVYEELTRIRPEYRCHMHPAVAARDDHCARMLALAGKHTVPCPAFFECCRAPPLITFYEAGRQRFRDLHVGSIFVTVRHM